jgi:hypothetical protein
VVKRAQILKAKYIQNKKDLLDWFLKIF